jgi:HD-GYP domain-containing protein (c-di-GMP phosphodiesterase class II)
VKKLRALQGIAVAIAIVMAVGSIRAAGGTAAFEPQAHYIAIVLAAIWFGPWGGALVGALCGIAAGPLTPASVDSGTPQELGAWLPRLIYFAAIGAVIGALNRRLLLHAQALERANSELETRNREIAEAERRAEERVRQLTESHTNEAQALAEIGALSHLDAAVLAGQPEGAIVETLAEIVCSTLQAHFGLVVYLNEGSDTFALQAQSGFYGESAANLAKKVGRLPVGQGLVGQAVLRRRPVFSSDVLRDDRRLKEEDLAEEACYRAGIAAPLMRGDEPFGAIWAGWRSTREFAETDGERMGRLAGQASLAIEKARQNRIIDDVTFDTVLALAEAIESRASYTSGHVERVVQYAEIITRELNLSQGEARAVRYGAALHDIGMVGVPDSVITKPDRLTPQEQEQIRLHPYIGEQLCKRAGFLAPLAPIICNHHERYDGRGYPHGLRGHAIPLGARIVAVADAFDAMTTERPYRPALSTKQAAEALRSEAGHQLDPEIVEVFLRALEGRRRRQIKAA